jgi:Fe-S-cluster-containing hydrogenase component 2
MTIRNDMKITLDLDECVGCGNCTTACPLGLTEVRRGRVHIKEGCDFCGKCMAACGYYVIKIEENGNHEEGKRTGVLWESR